MVWVKKNPFLFLHPIPACVTPGPMMSQGSWNSSLSPLELSGGPGVSGNPCVLLLFTSGRGGLVLTGRHGHERDVRAGSVLSRPERPPRDLVP